MLERDASVRPMTLPQDISWPVAPSIEEIVDDYVQRARSALRLAEYERDRKGDLDLHIIDENDQFRILHHVIAVRGKSVAWIRRDQDMWPTDRLTDITTVGTELTTVGVIHGGSEIRGVKFTLCPRRGAGSDPDNCLPFVSDFTHVEAHYRVDGSKMTLNRARMGIDFATKLGRTILARSVRQESAAIRNGGNVYQSSLGQRLLVRVRGSDRLTVNLPTELTQAEVGQIAETVTNTSWQCDDSPMCSLFVVDRD